MVIIAANSHYIAIVQPQSANTKTISLPTIMADSLFSATISIAREKNKIPLANANTRLLSHGNNGKQMDN